MTINASIIIAAAGLSAGSFACTVADRYGERRSLLARSRCNGCRQRLDPLSLVPLFGFLVRCGKCLNCARAIPARYPLIEIFSAAAALSIVAFSATGFEAVRHAVVGLLLLVSIQTDLRYRRIPNKAVVSGALGGLVVTSAEILFTGASPTPFLYGGGGALLVGLVVRGAGRALYHQPGMGYGDIKLFLSLGVLLGYTVFAVLTLAFVAAAITSVAGLIAGKLERTDQIPFAPFIGVGFFLAMLLPLSPWP